MICDILILLGGLCLVILGADWLVDGASSIARKAGLSEFLIGMTIVGIGTSMPELACFSCAKTDVTWDMSMPGIEALSRVGVRASMISFTAV